MEVPCYPGGTLCPNHMEIVTYCAKSKRCELVQISDKWLFQQNAYCTRAGKLPLLVFITALFRTSLMMSLKNRVAKCHIPDQEPGMIPSGGKWHEKISVKHPWGEKKKGWNKKKQPWSLVKQIMFCKADILMTLYFKYIYWRRPLCPQNMELGLWN